MNLDNLDDWFEAGAVAVFVNCELTAKALGKSDLNILERKACEYVKRIKATKERQE